MLSPAAEKAIDNYLNLPFPGIQGVRCPYFNNARLKKRGQLRVLVGKGSPDEIIEESKIISIQYHCGIFCKNGNLEEKPFTAEEIRRFLIDHNLGVECSGFVTQILKAHFSETKKFDFTKKIFIASPKNFFRWLIAKLRPVENIDVKVYADDRNSTRVIGEGIGYNYENVAPGDVITMLETGPLQKRNHILLITKKEGNIIHYVHARAWSTEGRFGHGVERGTISIIKPLQNLLEQKWTEKGISGDQNETYLEAKQAKKIEIRRIIL